MDFEPKHERYNEAIKFYSNIDTCADLNVGVVVVPVTSE
jgi:hypothetical protein